MASDQLARDLLTLAAAARLEPQRNPHAQAARRLHEEMPDATPDMPR